MEQRERVGVVVVGAGPNGMFLASELTLAGADVVVLEKRVERDLLGSRAGGLQARALEILDTRGLVERFLEAGTAAQVASFSAVPLDVSDAPSRHPYGLGLWQDHIERLLADHLDELGVEVRRGHEVVTLEQDDDEVRLGLADGTTVRASYVVACDGGRSRVRRLAGIGFEGWDATQSSLVAEVDFAEEPELGMQRDEHGIHAIGRLESGRYRVVLRDAEVKPSGEATLDDLRATLVAVRGTDHGAHSPVWISRFTDATRQATTYRSGRVLLAGDSAHVHSPMGGQGLTLGFQDVVALGWRLGLVLRGLAPDTLLDGYHDERHPADARALRLTMAMNAIARADPRTDALRDETAAMLAMDGPRRAYAARVSGLDVAHDLGLGDDVHPLLGRRMPDLDLHGADGPTRVAVLLRDGRSLLLDLGAGLTLDTSAWDDRLQRVVASYDGSWELPVVGDVDAPAAVLVRPDGHVAWVPSSPESLESALTRWLGPG